jgi:hypothetical protein
MTRGTKLMESEVFMKANVLPICLAMLMTSTLAQAVAIDVSRVEFTDFAPRTIEPGQRPTWLAYGFGFNKQSNDTVDASFSLSIALSANTAYGDSDDISLGMVHIAMTSLSGIAGHISSEFGKDPNEPPPHDPNGINGLRVPPQTVPGEYHAFLAIVPQSPDVDPDAGDAFGTLSALISVGSVPAVGDYNGNDIVDAGDYTLWRDTLGQIGEDLAADGNGSGTITGLDYDVWKMQYGETDGAPLASGIVPEPAAWAMLVVGMFVILPGRRHAWKSNERCGSSQ